MVLRAKWLPRLENEEADGLTNFDFRHFDPRNRIHVDLKDLNFAVLDDLFKVGTEYVNRLEAEKAKYKAAKLAGKAVTEKKRKTLAGERLKDTSRW